MAEVDGLVSVDGMCDLPWLVSVFVYIAFAID